jgi:hypothetical protein
MPHLFIARRSFAESTFGDLAPENATVDWMLVR